MARRDIGTDVAVALTAFALGALIAAGSDPEDPAVRDADAGAYVLMAAYCGAVAVRRMYPVPAVAVTVGAGLAYAGAMYPPALLPVGVLVLYMAATRLGPRPGRVGLVVVVAAAALQSTLGPGPTNLSVPLTAAGAWFLGSYVRERRIHADELEAKNRALEQAQHDLAHQAVTEERLRIARELHDVVAHSMSVVAVHAGSGRLVAADDPAAAARALETIETTTRTALGEMRRLLGVLRADDGEEPVLAPAPGLGDLAALVADVARSGVEVELRVEGARPLVPPSVDLSAYRVVQEALTNVLKHAGPARAAVDVRYGPTQVTVEVVDDGQGVRVAAGGAGGHGLAGMRERVAVHGGELDAGPVPAGGYRVMARFPLAPG